MYYLPEHVFACPVGNDIVLLDLKQDAYLTLTDDTATAFLRSVNNEADAPTSKRSAALSAEEAYAIEELIAAGLLTPKGKPLQRFSPTTPGVSLMENVLHSDLPITAGMIARAATSAICSSFRLRFSKMSQHVARAREMRHIVPAASCDDERLPRLVNGYFRARPVLFTSLSECLFDSMTLSDYLARFDLLPDWIFGVRTRPFAAHCWLQVEDSVLNDTVEHVRQYQPILVI